MSAPRRFRIRHAKTRRTLFTLEAATHGEAAELTSRTQYDRQFALRMTSWNGRDGIFAALDDRTGEEKERFFVEAEDGTGRIVVPPSFPPSYTVEDAKRMQAQQREMTNGKGKANGKRNGKAKHKRR
jgi:hypothetical protein